VAIETVLKKGASSGFSRTLLAPSRSPWAQCQAHCAAKDLRSLRNIQANGLHEIGAWSYHYLSQQEADIIPTFKVDNRAVSV